jgi:RHS repeat-associated protein
MGYGWTHSYNILLFSQLGHMFRMGADGRVTKYKLGPGGTFTATSGDFETLVRNPDGTFTLREKHGTTFRFAIVPGTPFFVVGPVWRLVSITDRNGNVTTLTYGAGTIVVTDTYGRQLVLSFTGKDLTAVTDPLGRTTRFTYALNGTLLTSISDPDGDTVQYSYNTVAQMTSKTDKDGRVFRFFYDSNGKPVSVRDSVGGVILTLANSSGWATNETALASDLMRLYVPSTTTRFDGRGNRWLYDYDSRGYVTRVTAPDGATTRYTYDPGTLQLATETDANNRTTSYQYDSLGNLTRKLDALGNVTSYTYEPVFSMMTSMTDANGRITRYAYDARGNRTQEIDPAGGVRRWTYDAHGNVLTEIDRNNNVMRYQYDAAGNLSQITDPLGNVIRMTYDVVGNLLSRTNQRGFTTRFSYDGLNRPVQEIDAVGRVTEFVYDGQGNRIEATDRNGNTTRYRYDLRQRLTEVIDPLGQSIRYSYDGNDNRVSSIDQNGRLTRFQYDVQDRLVLTTDAANNIRRMTYDGVGNKLTETDANGNVTRFLYDTLNRLVRRTDAELNVTQVFYDIVGGDASCTGICTGPTRGSPLVTKRTDAEGKVTYFKYDDLDRLAFTIRKQADTADVVDADDAVLRYTYDAHGNRLTAREPNGNVTRYAYDGLNRRIRLTNAAGDTTSTTYDAVGNVLTITAPNLNATTYSYDALDRPTNVDDAIGRVVSYSYDAVGNPLTDRDGNGNGTTYAYDALYRVATTTDALGGTTRYTYDRVSNLLTITDRQGSAISYLYDAIDRRTRTTDGLGNATQYQYDANGNLTRIVDANGNPTTYVYDRIDRMIRETYADGGVRSLAYNRVGKVLRRTDPKGQVTSYSYSDLYYLLRRSYPVGPADNMSYDLSGRLITAERGGWIITFAYDGANRTTRTIQDGEVVNYAYDVPGRRRTVIYPGGRVIVETGDARSRLGTIGDGTPAPPIVRYQYDVANRVVGRSYGNGTTSAYAYNANNWMEDLEHTRGTTRIAGLAYDFDREGNKRFEEKLPDGASSASRSEAYGYDAIHRLIDYRVGTLVGSSVPAPVTQTQYSLDPVGNWNVKTKDAVAESRSHRVTNEISRIGVVPVVSDGNGNTTDDGRFRYLYDEENRLTSVVRISDGRTVGRYQYDALGRRVKKIADPFVASSPAETRFYYDDTRIIEEQHPAGGTLATYVYGNYADEILAMDRFGARHYFHQNSLWSPLAATDALGSAAERYAYDAYGAPAVLDAAGNPRPANPWGTQASAIDNPWLFTGRQFDEESGLYYYRARYIDPAKGRFLQRDPLGYVDGMNLFQYAKSNPTRYLDPSGLNGEESSGEEKKKEEKCELCGPDVSDYYASELRRLEKWTNSFMDTYSYTWRFRRWGAFWDIAAGLDWWDANNESVTYKECPTEKCKGSVWLCGKCVGSHLLGNVAYGFVGRLLEFKWVTLRLGAHAHQLAEHGNLDPAGSRDAYDIGEVIAERTIVLTTGKVCRMMERKAERFKRAWQAEARPGCEKCPHALPQKSWPTTLGPRGEPGGVSIE